MPAASTARRVPRSGSAARANAAHYGCAAGRNRTSRVKASADTGWSRGGPLFALLSLRHHFAEGIHVVLELPALWPTFLFPYPMCSAPDFFFIERSHSVFLFFAL
jgi:hypothetical protein